ncbi:MFS general substrate transporter [Thozetella sp. PMI_491]|nr:MFS general substrate transporter [Thozetella sp. PMI_491]
MERGRSPSFYSSSVLGPEDNTRRKHSSADLSGSVFLISGDGRMLSLPIPSASPRDPLSWSKRKRLAILGVMMFFAVIALFALVVPVLMYRSLSNEYTEEMHPFNPESLNSFATVFMGVGALLWTPLSMALGRRPVVVASTTAFTMCMVWAAAARGFHSLLAATSVAGFAAGVNISTTLLVIIDLTFIHERPQAIAAWFSVGGAISLAASSLVPLMVNETTTWRFLYEIWIIPSATASLFTFLFVPETYFLRPPVAFDGRILIQSGAERVRIYEDFPRLLKCTELPKLPETSKFKSWLSSLALFGSAGGEWKSAMACYPQMLLCLANPLIFWVVLMNAANFAGMMSIGLTYPVLLSKAPYNLPSAAVSLVNLGAAAGSLLAWPASGIIIDRITKRLATLNGGVRHAEYLLPGFFLPVLSGAASVFIYAIVAEKHYHFLWVYLSYFLNAFSFASMSAASTLWVTEAFPYWAAAALAAVGGLSYMTSFPVSAALPLWMAAQGYFWVNIEIGIALVLLGFVSVPIAFWGKSVRQYIHGRWGVYETGALRPQ